MKSVGDATRLEHGQKRNWKGIGGIVMTNQEVADELQYAIDLIKQNGKDWLDERDIPVLEMAISALQAQEIRDLLIVSPLLDKKKKKRKREKISALQEQEELYVDSKCKTCRYYHDHDDVRCMICDDENDMREEQEAKHSTELSSTHKALDTISRQAAIDAVGKCTDIYVNNLPTMVDKAEAYKALNEVPSAQPEPQWISVNENQPEKYGWYLCSLKDGRVNALYWHNRKGWIDNVRMNMFELYDIRSKLTGNEVKPENESVYWNDWVKAWKPLPESYREDGGE